jgi:DNA repair exonuclease SbcCD ATPase subunit
MSRISLMGEITNYLKNLESWGTDIDEKVKKLENDFKVLNNIPDIMRLHERITELENVERLDDRIDELSNQIDRIESDYINDLESRIDELENETTEITDLEYRLDNLDDLGGRIDELENDSYDIEEIQSDIGDLEREVGLMEGTMKKVDDLIYKVEMEKLDKWEEKSKEKEEVK